ncbi:hypothetical protein L6R50_04140 [Myxococcota bacterium]|nr:hypothetical protein [Myxococcota bacterium]
MEGDCDDGDPDVFPGMAELCDGKDNDCDPLTVEDADGDGDGASVCDGDCDDAEPLLNPVDADGDGFSTCTLDCDDADAAVVPDDGADQQTSGFLKLCTPLLEPHGTWDEDFLVQASVIYDGEYKMYYRGGEAAANQAVGLATSPDGIDWTHFGTTAVFDLVGQTWESNGISAPWVVREPLDETWPYKLYYHAKEPDGSRSIGLAVSADGISWTRWGTAPIVSHGDPGTYDEKNAHAPTVVPGGLGTWHMWYSAKTDDDVYSIAYATSEDLGYTWTKFEANPIFAAAPVGEWDAGRITHPSILPRGSGYQFWYAGSADTAYDSIGYGISPDLVAWERWPHNPVLTPGAAGRWDASELWAASVYDLGDRYYMFYSAADEGAHYGRFGLAINQRPGVEVYGPAEGAVLDSATTPWFAGRVEDDFVETTTVTFQSDVDGVLAELAPDPWGRVVVQAAQPLTPGSHVIRMRAQDDSGLERAAEVTVTVE